VRVGTYPIGRIRLSRLCRSVTPYILRLGPHGDGDLEARRGDSGAFAHAHLPRHGGNITRNGIKTKYVVSADGRRILSVSRVRTGSVGAPLCGSGGVVVAPDKVLS
jgi:hypothetical protein